MFGKKVVVKINGMSCEHCAKKVEKGLEKVDNVKSVKVDLKNKNATLRYKDNIDLNQVKNIIDELEYEYVGVEFHEKN